MESNRLERAAVAPGCGRFPCAGQQGGVHSEQAGLGIGVLVIGQWHGQVASHPPNEQIGQANDRGQGTFIAFEHRADVGRVDLDPLELDSQQQDVGFGPLFASQELLADMERLLSDGLDACERFDAILSHQQGKELLAYLG